MGNYEQLKQAVTSVIKNNGNYEITGDILQNTLLSIISTVGGNATFAGIATPTTNPGTPDQNVFYIASQNGTYTNFGGITLENKVVIFSNVNGSWVMTDTGIATKKDVEALQNVEDYDILVSGNTEVSPNADSVDIRIQNLNVNGPSTNVETINIPAATESKAGVMSAADKKILDYYNSSRGSYLEANISYDTDNVSLGNVRFGVVDDIETNPITLSAATTEQAGVMSAKDKTLLTKIENIYLPYYGIEFDTTISTPTCTRIGDSDLHKSLPIQSRMRGCLLDDNGNVVEYLNPTSWLGHDRTGSRGQVMVEIPSHYERFVTDGTKRRVMLSEYPIPGFQFIPTMYVSAYEASLQRSTNKLCSVVNDSADYRGGANNAAWDGTYRSLLGRPATKITRGDFRKYARNRNAAATAEWNCYTYDVHKTLFWLFVVEYATLNSQASYNSEPTSEGYRQGGLGAGVTTWDWGNWTTFNGQYPFVPCGHTDSLGNRTGVVSYTAKNDDESISKTFDVPRYRGVENPFGHIWKWTDGCNIQVSASQENGGTGLSKAFICHNPANFQDSNYANYSHVGNIDRVGGYIKEVLFGVGGEILSKLAGGGSTTYFCDNHYTNIPTSGEALRGLLFGGYAYSGAHAGLACAGSNIAPSYANPSFGSRLCFIPEAK